MSVANRPSRAALSQDWLEYLDDLHDALLPIHPDNPQTLALRFEITIAENELIRRGLPPNALVPLQARPDGGEVYTPLQWEHPEVQALFGKALVKTAQKHKDPHLLRLGWGHQQAARNPSPRQVNLPASSMRDDGKPGRDDLSATQKNANTLTLRKRIAAVKNTPILALVPTWGRHGRGSFL
jgi:hypothetical protein